MKFKRMIFAAATILLLVGYGANPAYSQQLITSNSYNENFSDSGNYGGYFYNFWADNRGGSVSMTVYNNGSYDTTCNNLTGGFVGGIGWNPGSRYRVVNFDSSYSSDWGGAFGPYGWTTNPLVEYYVIEHRGDAESPIFGTDLDTGGTIAKADYYG